MYTTSSKRVLSEGSDNVSFKVIKEEEEGGKKSSTLVKNLEKDNPGIIN